MVITIARNVRFSFLRGGGSSLEVLYGKVSLTPTNLHTLSTTAVLPAPTTFDLINGSALATNVAPTPAPVDGAVAWAYKVKVTDTYGKSWEYLVGVPDGTSEINFNVLPRYTETRPPAYGVGPAGPAGQSATIAIGTTTSGPTPAVTNSGTSTNAVLNFTLAKGDKGDAGEGVPVGGTALQVIRKNAANTTTEWATLTKSLVGLGNVDNTSDANKPVSTAQQSAIDAVSNGLDNKVTDFAQNSSSALGTYLNAKFVENNSLVANVRDYGADNTGNLDTTTAVQDAMNYLSSIGGGALYFPPGEYFVLGTIVLTSNIVIYGPGAVIRKKSPSPNYIVFLGLSKNVLGYGGGVRNIVCRDITFRGDLPNGYAIGAFALHRAQDVTLLNVKVIEGVVGGHVLDLQGCDNVKVLDSTFAGARTSSGRAYTEAIQVDSSSAQGFGFPSTYWAAEICDGTPSRNITVSGCSFRPITVGGTLYKAPSPFGSHSYVENNYYNNITFENNYVEHVTAPQSGDSYAGILHFVAVRALRIRGNTFIGDGNIHYPVNIYRSITATPLSEVNNVTSSTVETSNPSVALDVDISGNTFSGFSNTSSGSNIVSVVGDFQNEKYAEGIRILNNRFKDNYPAGAVLTLQGPNPVNAAWIKGIIVSGNTTNRGRSFAYITDSFGVSVEGNDIDTVASYPVYLLRCSNTRTSGNTIARAAARSIVSGGSNHIVAENSVQLPASVGATAGVAWDLTGVTRTVFSTNVLDNPGSLSAGIRVLSATDKTIIRSNVILGYTTPISVSGDSTVVQDGNITT